MRNLTKTLTAVSLMAPVGAFSLGVGDIKLHSSLNQHLNAEISLNLVEDESIEDVRVKLASPEKFDEVGVPWTYFLSKIKFEPILRPDGSVIIKLSSEEVLKEPFLDFLLKVSWPEGNVYREFTVLVDPPAVYQQQVVQITVEKDLASNSQTSTAVKDQQQEKPALTEQVISGNQTYGPTNRLDTLWKIADKVKPESGVSVEQMMMGLFEVNPDAFIQGNVNALKAGKTLQIPEMDVILKLSHRQARAEFKKHVNSWVGKVSPKPAENIEQPQDIKSESEEIKQQLQLLAPAEAEINQNVEVTPTVSETLEPDAAVTEVAEQQEPLDSQEDQTLQERLTKLEQQLAMMQKMLQLKDEQLANLQRSSNEIPDSVAVPSEVKKPELTKPAEQVVKAVPKPIKPVAKPAPQVQPVPESESSLIYLVAAGIGISLIGVFGWFWKRRVNVEEEESLSMFASSSEISLPETDEELSVPIVEDALAGIDVGTVGESSFLSEFTPSDFDAFETEQNEVDPISEADVYLAYGRYQQAEELMRQAIADHPDKNECKLKLLEIFYANENMEAFETYTQELVADGSQDKTEFWSKVVEMGTEICPDSALFNAKAVEDVTSKTNAEEDKADIEDTVLAQPLAQSEAVDSDQVDFDLTTFELPEDKDDAESTETDENISAVSADDDNGLDFDLSASEEKTVLQDPEEIDNIEQSDHEEISIIEQSVAVESLESLDFDVSSTESNSDTQEEVINLSDEVSGSAESLESFDFDALNKDDEESTVTSDDASEFDFSFDLDNSDKTSNEEIAENEGMDTAVSDLTDMDEIETKIDLAKAYIDMGDESAAKNLTEEVLEKGSDKQKQEAQAILEKLQ